MLRYDPDLLDTKALHDHTHNPARGTVEEAYGGLTACDNCGGTDGPVQSIMATIRGILTPMTVCLGCARFIEDGAVGYD